MCRRPSFATSPARSTPPARGGHVRPARRSTASASTICSTQFGSPLYSSSGADAAPRRAGRRSARFTARCRRPRLVVQDELHLKYGDLLGVVSCQEVDRGGRLGLRVREGEAGTTFPGRTSSTTVRTSRRSRWIARSTRGRRSRSTTSSEARHDRPHRREQRSGRSTWRSASTRPLRGPDAVDEVRLRRRRQGGAPGNGRDPHESAPSPRRPAHARRHLRARSRHVFPGRGQARRAGTKGSPGLRLRHQVPESRRRFRVAESAAWSAATGGELRAEFRRIRRRDLRHPSRGVAARSAVAATLPRDGPGPHRRGGLSAVDDRRDEDGDLDCGEDRADRLRHGRQVRPARHRSRRRAGRSRRRRRPSPLHVERVPVRHPSHTRRRRRGPKRRRCTAACA